MTPFRRLEEAMEQRRVLEMGQENADWKKLRRGWCWGREEFREELLERIGSRRGRQHYGEELRESDQQKAERLTKEMLGEAGWGKADLARQPKGDKQKARMAARLRGETTMTWPWIAERLGMGHWRTAANSVRALSKRTPR